MGNTVRAGVTWSRCGAVVSLSLITGIHHNTPGPHYRPIYPQNCSKHNKSVLCTVYYVYWPAHRWETGRIYNHPTEGGGSSGDKIC